MSVRPPNPLDKAQDLLEAGSVDDAAELLRRVREQAEAAGREDVLARIDELVGQMRTHLRGRKLSRFDDFLEYGATRAVLRWAALAILLLYYGAEIVLGIEAAWSPLWAVFVAPVVILAPLADLAWRRPLGGRLLLLLGVLGGLGGLVFGVLVGWLEGFGAFGTLAYGVLFSLIVGGPLIVSGLLFLRARAPARTR